MQLAPEAFAGETATHSDLRPDNLLLDGDGACWTVDWNWLALGPRWMDWVGLLPVAQHHGIDTSAAIRSSPLTAGVPADHLDCFIARCGVHDEQRRRAASTRVYAGTAGASAVLRLDLPRLARRTPRVVNAYRGAMTKGPTTRFKVEVLDGERTSRREDVVVTEEPLELRLEWPGRPPEPLMVTMRTPGSDFELAAGFCLGEGFAVRPDAIRTVAYCTDVKLTPEQQFNTVTVTFDGPPDREPPQRYGVTSAACGVCGQQSLDELAERDYDPVDPVEVPVDVVRRLPDLLREAQPTFSRTGGLHAAGLFTADGRKIVVKEDVGRHNAVDKVVGWTVLNHHSRKGLVLAVSGRAGYEIIQKAVAAGIGMIVAVGAPSSLAVDLARRFNVTVAGFTRGDRCVVYSTPERIRRPA